MKEVDEQGMADFIAKKNMLYSHSSDELVDGIAKLIGDDKSPAILARAKSIVNKAANLQKTSSEDKPDYEMTLRKFGKQTPSEAMGDVATSPDTAVMVGGGLGGLAGSMTGGPLGRALGSATGGALMQGASELYKKAAGKENISPDETDDAYKRIGQVAAESFGWSVGSDALVGIGKSLYNSFKPLFQSPEKFGKEMLGKGAMEDVMKTEEALMSEKSTGLKDVRDKIFQAETEDNLAKKQLEMMAEHGAGVSPLSIGEDVRLPLKAKKKGLEELGSQRYVDAPESGVPLRKPIDPNALINPSEVTGGGRSVFGDVISAPDRPLDPLSGRWEKQTSPPYAEQPSSLGVSSPKQPVGEFPKTENPVDKPLSALMAAEKSYNIESVPPQLKRAIGLLQGEDVSSYELGQTIKQLKQAGGRLYETDEAKARPLFEAATALKEFYKQSSKSSPEIKASFDAYLNANKWWATNVGPLNKGLAGDVLKQSSKFKYDLPFDKIAPKLDSQVNIRKLVEDVGLPTAKDIVYQNYIMDLSQRFAEGKLVTAGAIKNFVNSRRTILDELWPKKDNPFTKIENIRADLDSYQKEFIGLSLSNPAYIAKDIISKDAAIPKKMKSLANLIKLNPDNIAAIRQGTLNELAEEYKQLPLDEAFTSIKKDYPDLIKFLVPNAGDKELLAQTQKAMKLAKKSYSYGFNMKETAESPLSTLMTAVSLIGGDSTKAPALKAATKFYFKLNRDQINEFMIKAAYDPSAARILKDIAKGVNTDSIKQRIIATIGTTAGQSAFNRLNRGNQNFGASQ